MKTIIIIKLFLLFAVSSYVFAVDFVNLSNCQHKIKNAYKYRYCDISIDGKPAGLVVIKEGKDFYGPFGVVGGYFNFKGGLIANNVDKKQAFLLYRPQGYGTVVFTECGSKHINSRYIEDIILTGLKCAEILQNRRK